MSPFSPGQQLLQVLLREPCSLTDSSAPSQTIHWPIFVLVEETPVYSIYLPEWLRSDKDRVNHLNWTSFKIMFGYFLQIDSVNLLRTHQGEATARKKFWTFWNLSFCSWAHFPKASALRPMPFDYKGLSGFYLHCTQTFQLASGEMRQRTAASPSGHYWLTARLVESRKSSF